MVTLLSSVVDTVIATNAPSAPPSRAWDLDEARTYMSAAAIRGRAEPNFDRALHDAEAQAKTVLVTGSFHTVGDAMQRLGPA